MDRKNGRYRVGSVGVDAGMVMVGDPCYLDKWGKDSANGTEYIDNEVAEQQESGEYKYTYSGACAATLGEHGAGELGNADAVAVSSGYGDGVYPVFATYNHDGRIVKLEVIFDGDHGDDDSDEE
jgi:hypothetical protein